MAGQQLLSLVCQTCRWRPPRELSMGVVAAHIATEHPEQVNAEGDPDVRLDMVVICPRCDVEVPLTSSTEHPDHVVYQHDCLRCHRTYALKADR